MISFLVALVSVIVTILSYYWGMKAERDRVLRAIDMYIHHATLSQEELMALAARAVRRRVADPVTFK